MTQALINPLNHFPSVANHSLLGGTGLSSLPAALLANLPKLTSLYIDDNNLTGLDPTFFDNNPLFDVLAICNNKLIQADTLPAIQTITFKELYVMTKVPQCTYRIALNAP